MADNSSAIADKFPPRAPAPGRAGRGRILVASALLLTFGALGAAEDIAQPEATALPGTIEVLTVRPAKMAPATLAVADGAHLVLTLPLSVHPEATVEFAADPGGMAGVRLNVRAGETCLLDFAVSALGAGVYTIAADSGKREFEDPEGTLRHLLIGLKAEAGGWTTVRLQRSGAGYHLHSVEVTGALQERNLSAIGLAIAAKAAPAGGPTASARR